ncbi:MAG: ABC transporter permease [Anaerolineae bacterium]|nr:ABC transporter permease [Anaerolineae bacterium]
MTTPSEISTPVEFERPHIPEWKSLWMRFRRNRSARLGGLIVILYVLIAVSVPILDDYDARRDSNLRARLTPPTVNLGDVETPSYPFGTDDLGRDILRRVGHGASVSLTVSIFAVSVSVLLGVTIGEVAGFLGGWVDSVLMRIMDTMMAFPFLLLAITLLAILGPGLINGMIAVGIGGIPGYARLARSMALGIRSEDYVMAAQSVGAKSNRILWQHVLPNSLAPLIVQATLGLGTAVISTAALGFLGLGQQAPYPELGKMLAESQQYLVTGSWWGMVFPGIAITLVVLGFNLLGDGLRDTLDPKLRGVD